MTEPEEYTLHNSYNWIGFYNIFLFFILINIVLLFFLTCSNVFNQAVLKIHISAVFIVNIEWVKKMNLGENPYKIS